MRAQADGHQVRWYIPLDPKTEHIGEGLVPIVREYGPSVHWADLIIATDNVAYLGHINAARKEGAAIIGPTPEAASWELDRVAGMEVLREHGIEVPEYQEFQTYDEAIRYVKKHDRPFVSKPSGSDPDKALSYVAKTPADLVYMLERWKRGSKLKPPFILQQKVEGVEFAVGAWFGPHGFNSGWCENFEFKKLCVGDLGCATGEQGTVVVVVRKSKLARMVLEPLAEELERLGYVGYVDVNTIVDEKGTPWPLEWTMRPGWPTLNIQFALHEGDAIQWLADLHDGDDALNFRMNEIAMGVVLSIPDYPYSHITRKEVTGVPIYGITEELDEHVHPCEMMMGVAPHPQTMRMVDMPCTAGDYVLVMTATGASVSEAKRTVYSRLKQLNVPNNSMYRTDIGDRLKKQLPLLHNHGFATGISHAKVEKQPERPKEDSLVVGQTKIIYV
jgi:phosphoribosylamine--glycine ligase